MLSASHGLYSDTGLARLRLSVPNLMSLYPHLPRLPLSPPACSILDTVATSRNRAPCLLAEYLGAAIGTLCLRAYVRLTARRYGDDVFPN